MVHHLVGFGKRAHAPVITLSIVPNTKYTLSFLAGHGKSIRNRSLEGDAVDFVGGLPPASRKVSIIAELLAGSHLHVHQPLHCHMVGGFDGPAGD